MLGEKPWVPVTIVDAVFVPGLKQNLISLSKMQRKGEVLRGSEGTHLLGTRVSFQLLGNGNNAQIVRVPADDPGSQPTVAVAFVCPGKRRNINVNDLHLALAHRSFKIIQATAAERGMNTSSLRQFYDACAEARAFKIAVPRVLSVHR